MRLASVLALVVVLTSGCADLCGPQLSGLRAAVVVDAPIEASNETVGERLAAEGFALAPLPGGFSGTLSAVRGNLTVRLQAEGHFASRDNLTWIPTGKTRVEYAVALEPREFPDEAARKIEVQRQLAWSQPVIDALHERALAGTGWNATAPILLQQGSIC